MIYFPGTVPDQLLSPVETVGNENGHYDEIKHNHINLALFRDLLSRYSPDQL